MTLNCGDSAHSFPLPAPSCGEPRDVVRFTAWITGKVQGVNYRVTARREARRRGLAGWVRNEPDGSVLIDVEGAPAAVDDFLRWCAEGPPGATVTSMGTTPASPAGYDEFAIRR